MPYELVYSSLAVRPMERSELIELLKQSRDKNARIGITGLLIYHMQEFAQILEGEERAVKDLYETIKNDERHEHVRTVWEGSIDKRGFYGWSMGFIDSRDVELEKIDGFSLFMQSAEMDYSSETKTKTKEMLLAIREMILTSPKLQF